MPAAAALWIWPTGWMRASSRSDDSRRDFSLLHLSDTCSRFSGARRHTWYDRPTMSGDETAFLLPVMEVFCKAHILAESENAAEIGVDHLLSALESPAAVNHSTLHALGSYL